MTARESKGRIVVTGMAFYIPLPGVVYQVLHYMTALRHLGYEVWYVEDSTRWVYDSAAQEVVADASANVAIVASLLDAHGFSDRWGFRNEHETGRCYGMTSSQVQSLYASCDALLNVTGQSLHDDQLACARRIYVETDPFATQVKLAQGDAETKARLAGHDTWFTFGENIGAADCGIPDSGFPWLPTRQPVDLDVWQPTLVSEGTRYTTITTWVNHIDSVKHDGEVYHWRKDLEFEKFLDLPGRSSQSFELALTVERSVLQMLESHGWHHVTSTEISKSPDRYRDYIRSSRAEFTVARDQYVRPRTGWFSDRSACYLAAGKPVITQDSAFGKFLPTGRGLFAFTSLDDIIAAVDMIETDYRSHQAAALEIAAEYFAGEKVVGSLMERAGL